jgi:TPR repeat protein
MRFAAVLFLGFLLLPALAYAGPVEDGKAAFARKNYQTALTLLRPLADQGNATAQLEVGLIYEHGLGVSQDLAEAHKWLQKSADQGCAGAQYRLGLMYVYGIGVPRNLQVGRELEQKAFENSSSDCKDVDVPTYVYVPPDKGVIPDQATAIEVAEAILKRVYGEDNIKREEPFTAALEDGIWRVGGSLPKGHIGGVAEIHIAKSDGRVMFIVHGE